MTERQYEYLGALIEHKTVAGAAKSLGLHRTTVSEGLAKLKKSTPEAFEHFAVAGMSYLYDADGNLKSQSVRISPKKEQSLESLRDSIYEGFSSNLPKISPKIKEVKGKIKDYLLSVYPLGDPHFGLHVWGEQCGVDFDLKEAKRLLFEGIKKLVQASPESETGVLLSLGDTIHINDKTNKTPAHKHDLDADSRYQKIMVASVEAFRHAIELMLTRHQKVIVKIIPGNHDPESHLCLAMALSAYYSNTSRVHVDLSPARHWYHRFHSTLIGATHGDQSKPAQLPGVMSVDRSEDWGQTKYRYWLTGHLHTEIVREYAGCTVETFRTIAPQDSYAEAHGYRSGRDMRCIVYHADHGEIARYRCDVSMLEEPYFKGDWA